MPNSGAPGLGASLGRMFPRVSSRALGVAVGVTTGAACFLLTVIHVLFELDGLPIGLLNQYFYGYQVTWRGAVAGLIWGFATGFVGGCLLGFVHNATVGAWLLMVRTKTDLSQKRNIVDTLR